MAYIGDKPSQTLASPTSQYFNGDGSTVAFTLNRAVNVAEDLEVFVNNIQQEPGVGKSYTATGTTLTFDAAPSAGTANVYVVYRGLAEVTTRLEHDPNAALAATTGTFSGDLTVDTNTLYVDSTNNRVGIGQSSPATPLHINGAPGTSTLRLDAGGTLSGSRRNWGISAEKYAAGSLTIEYGSTEGAAPSNAAMTIDSSGRVTMPYQPAFFAYNLNFPGSGLAGTASGGTDTVNVGSHYSTGTGRFTAPIAGTYVFYMMTQAYDSGNTSGQYQTAIFQKNGSNVGAETYHGWAPPDGNNHVQAQNTIIITLAANDYMMAYVQFGARDIQNYFGGYLLG